MSEHDPLRFRDELIAEAAKAIRRTRQGTQTARIVVSEEIVPVLYAVESLIRADERERCSKQLAEVDSRVRDMANAAAEATVEFVRSEERELIAKAIEAYATEEMDERWGYVSPVSVVLYNAARIARNGGS